MEFTLVLTVVLGLCVGAVVADVLFGPEQPATSSSGSHGDQWDPWRSWLRKARQRVSRIGSWFLRSGERGWAALARSFPAQRGDSDAPPLDILPPPVAPPLHAPRAPAPPVARPQVAAFVDQRTEVEREPAAGAVATLPRPTTYPAPALAPTLRPTASAEPVQPMVVSFPARVRLKAGAGLIVYVAMAGAALAATVLLVAGLVARAAGQI